MLTGNTFPTLLPFGSMADQAKFYRIEGSPSLSGPYVFVCLAGPVEIPVEEGVSVDLGSRKLPTSHTHIQGTVAGTQLDSSGASNSTSPTSIMRDLGKLLNA